MQPGLACDLRQQVVRPESCREVLRADYIRTAEILPGRCLDTNGCEVTAACLPLSHADAQQDCAGWLGNLHAYGSRKAAPVTQCFVISELPLPSLVEVL